MMLAEIIFFSWRVFSISERFMVVSRTVGQRGKGSIRQNSPQAVADAAMVASGSAVLLCGSSDLDVRHQPASGEDVLDDLRWCHALQQGPVIAPLDPAGVDVEPRCLSCGTRLRFRQDQQRQSDVDGVAVEDARERWRHDAGDPRALEATRRMLARAAAAEVRASEQDVAGLEALRPRGVIAAEHMFA